MTDLVIKEGQAVTDKDGRVVCLAKRDIPLMAAVNKCDFEWVGEACPADQQTLDSVPGFRSTLNENWKPGSPVRAQMYVNGAWRP